MVHRKRFGGGASHTLHIPFDPVTWPKVRDLAASRAQSMETLVYLAVMKELDAAVPKPELELEGPPIDINRWAVFDRSRG